MDTSATSITAITAGRLNVAAWPDPQIDATGYPPGSPYIDLVWLGILGPSATWAWTYLARIVATKSAAVVDLDDFAATLGIARGGRRMSITHTLDRLVRFGAARRVDNILAVRRRLPAVPDHQLHRLSATARTAHQRVTARQAEA